MLMEVTGPERGLQRLEDLADKLDAHMGYYDQSNWCSCAYRLAHSEKSDEQYSRHVLPNLLSGSMFKSIAAEFHIATVDAMILFGGQQRRNDSKETAARIRAFVYEKRKELVAA